MADKTIAALTAYSGTPASTDEIPIWYTAGSATKKATIAQLGLALYPASPAQGDIIYYNGTAWVRLAAGTSGYFLKTNGAGANPAWAAGGGSIALGGANQVYWSDGATNQWTGLPTVTRVDVTSSYRVNGTTALSFTGTTLIGANQTTWTAYRQELQATGTFDWSWGGNTYWTLTGNGGAVVGSAAAAATSLTIQHAARTTPGTGGNLTIKAQDGNTGGGGGSLILAAGDKDAAGTPGTVQVYCYGGTQLTISSGTGGFLFKPAKAQSACTYQQEDNTTASATGATTTICSQNATGATSVGGDMAITTGTGTTRSGNLLLSATGSGAAAGYVACTSNAQEIWRCQTDGTYLLKYGGVQIMASDTSGQVGIKSLKALAGNPFKFAYLDKSIAAGGTITLANTEYDYADINLTGAQASATTVVFPATIGATWRVTNNATAAFGVALQASGGSRLVHVGRAQTVEVRCDGAELYVVNGKAPVVVLAEGLIDYNGTSGTNTDTTLYTFPANAFGIITSVELVLDTAQTGATSVCTLTVGDTAGGTQWILSQTINTSTAVDTDYGLATTHLGSNFDATKGYTYVKPRATSKSIIARCARSVATVTAGKLRYRVIGSVLW